MKDAWVPKILCSKFLVQDLWIGK
eukprot:SAG25_NODE_11155_length_312_cov_0.732394_1_plen_23_part_01